MSYEKYIKYKTKYLNLKATIHNKQIQSGGAPSNTHDNDFIQTLGSTPNSDIFNNNYDLFGGAKKKLSEKSVSSNSLPDKLSSSESSESNKLPDELSSSESTKKSDKLSSSESDKLSDEPSSSESNKLPDELSSSESKKLIGGARKLKKTVNVFSESESNSDSDFNGSDSSLLSFSSVASTSSSD